MQNLILADCEREELEPFVKGLEESMDQKFEIRSKICNGKRGSIQNVIRYLIYIFYPVKIFLKRRGYNYIIGWQQFFALFYIFYCNLFRVKKTNIVVVGNFTYKEKRGVCGKLYKRVMTNCLQSKYLDYIHVPSQKYAEQCAREFKIAIEKFVIVPFGLEDAYEKWKDSKVEYEEYSLAIGRSNRDYDFLIDTWKRLPKKYKLLIICDEYKTKNELPENIILRTDIVGNDQFPYIMNCELMIIPIKDGNICSGDTVLLKAMSYYKTVVVTSPSTLAEMYIKDGENGICIEKDVERFSKEVEKLLEDETKRKKIGQNARKSFISNFSRYNMGKKMGERIKIER